METYYLNDEVSALVSARIQRAQRELQGGLSEELFQELNRLGNEITQRAAEIEDMLGFAE